VFKGKGKKMLIAVGIVAVVLVAGVLGFAATRPDTFRVQRTASIKAPPERIFALINDFQAWGAWSPYEKADPAMKKTFTGPATGTGSVYEWDGNRMVGAGRVAITASEAPSRVALSLDMSRPFECHNAVNFTLEPRGDATNVTWAMHGPNTFMGKVMSLFINMDTMVGGQFEEGLANLKSLAER
jgi:uncharacterized protein YndB with AHSA1/START domain